MANMDTFFLSDALIRKILNRAMSRGGDFADLYAEHCRTSSLTMEEGILKSAYCSVEKGVGLRVVKGEKTGYAYTEQLTPKHFDKIADVAAAIAGDKGSLDSFALNPVTFENLYPVNDPAADVDLDLKIAWINKANELAHSLSEKVSKVAISFVDNHTELLMADSRGRLIFDQRPMLRMSIQVVVQENGEVEVGRSGGGARVGFSWVTAEKVEDWTRQAVREALIRLEAQQAPSGTLPILLGPGDSGILLHEAIGHPLEADFNRKGSSAYTGRMGEKVADSQCTIIDDGTIAAERGSINTDDELNPSQKTVLIEEGVLRSYMYDEMSARYFDVDSSGNGRRESYRYQPLPRMRTTYMLPGKYEADEIIKSTKKGIYCKTFKGGQVDISNGNFTFVPSEAWLVEDGEMKHPVKNFTLIGNGPDVLSKVTMVGSDFKMSAGTWTCGKGQQVPVGVGLPTIKISGMTVGGRG